MGNVKHALQAIHGWQQQQDRQPGIRNRCTVCDADQANPHNTQQSVATTLQPLLPADTTAQLPSSHSSYPVKRQQQQKKGERLKTARDAPICFKIACDTRTSRVKKGTIVWQPQKNMESPSSCLDLQVAPAETPSLLSCMVICPNYAGCPRQWQPLSCDVALL